MERISSRHNAIVKRFRDLARASRPMGSGRGDRASPADQTAEVLLDGDHLVHEALACDVAIDIAAFSEKELDKPRSPLVRTARDVKKHGGRVLSVSDQILSAMSPVQHPSGVVAIGRVRPATLRVAMSAAGGVPLVVVLAGLQDPGNVGAIVRAAAAFGATGVIAIEGSANPFGWKALRGAMGGTFRIPVATRGTLPDVIAAARETGLRLVAAVPRGGTPLPELDLRIPAALVLGGEGAGVPAETVTAVERTVSIPMAAAAPRLGSGQVESLNVAVAAAVILYEAMRQRDA